MKATLNHALTRATGLLVRADVPELASQLDWALRQNELAAVLPGIYALPTVAESLEVRARAICLADSKATICGRAAAVLHGWTGSDNVSQLVAASETLRSRDWLTIERRIIPTQLVRRIAGIRCTSRALTAVDLIPELGSSIVDEALRRHVRLDEMHTALQLTPNRRGNNLRRQALRDSRDRPWSFAEREAHRALRAAGIKGWRANVPVIAAPDDPPVAFLDLAFKHLRLAIEIDGSHHDDPAEVRRDRLRDETLALLGWQIVRFSARRVLNDPAGFAAAVQDLIRVRARLLGKL